MADIFLSYAREDLETARALGEALSERGWSVWWDRRIPPGKTFAEVIANNLAEARSVIVLWSKASLTSHWVRDEAQVGVDRNILTPILIEDVQPPLGFRGIQTADLIAWDGDRSDPRFVHLADALAGGLGIAAGTSAVPERFESGEEQRGPGVIARLRRLFRKRRRAFAAATGLFGVLAVSVGAGLYLNQPQADCGEPPRWPQPEGRSPGEVFSDCEVCPQLVVLPLGAFTIGARAGDADALSDEKPAREIVISRPVAVGKNELTFAEWDACVEDGGCNGYRPDDLGWGRDGHPVLNVSWLEAKAYTRWLSDKTGKHYRLLTEAEWEYACRAGSDTRFSGTDSITPAQANFDRNVGRTQPGGSYPANAWGLNNMSGNVWEWVEDDWHDGHRGISCDASARGGDSDVGRRVMRGGSWDDKSRRVRCSSRNAGDTDDRRDELGFRVARLL